MKRCVNPRDLPYAAAGGTYHVVNGALEAEAKRAEAEIQPEPAAVEPGQASDEDAPEAAPSARPKGGRHIRSKE
jgi:hypothetical protein